MNALEQLTNVEKAKLLHELFPGEMPALLQHIKEACRSIEKDKDTIEADWENQLLTADFWFTLSHNAKQTIDKYGARLEKSSRLFADQLFNGYAAIFSVDSIIKYAGAKCKNQKFIKAVDLLFIWLAD